MNMDLIDSHAHLDMLEDPASALELARQAGVSQVVSVGIDPDSSRQALELAGQNPGKVFATVGLHPHDAAQGQDDCFAQMEELAASPLCVAIGECGLDFFRDRSPRPQQRLAFARQIELALGLKLPLVIHDRDAHQEVADLLREQDAARVGGVVHCFSGDRAMARAVLDMGFFLGIPGPITYPANQELRDLAAWVGVSRLLVETDCPFLSPVPKRGRPNQPAYVRHTAQVLAQSLGMSLEETARATSANARGLFGLPPAEE